MGNFAIRASASVLFACASAAAGAQSFTEDFDNVSPLTGNGWFIQNNSNPLGPNSWYQGIPTSASPTPGPFNAFNGADNAYISANFASTTGGTGLISNWLGTPNRTFRNGDVFQFSTRKPGIGPGMTDFPDRLEVRLSTNGASTNVGAPGNNVGDFTTLLLSINPTLVPGGYPQLWTQYTLTISGLPAPTSGRIALRYFVSNGGPSGSNSDYIGVDNVVYSAYTCPTLAVSPATLGSASFGQAYSASLGQTGALGAPSYAVTAGVLPPGLTLGAGGQISGTPTIVGLFNFTVTVSDASGCSGSRPYSITVNPSAPGAPQAVNAIAADSQATVSWVPPASDGGDPVDDYQVSCTDGGANTGGGTSAESPLLVTGLVNGVTYTCTVRAVNAAGAGPASAPSGAFTPKANQTITFEPQAAQVYSPGGTFAIDPPATASSGLAVDYGSLTTDVCTVDAGTVSIVAAGTCTLTADQPGSAAWHPAVRATQSLDIAKAPQALAFPAQTVASRFIEAGSTFPIDPLATSAMPNAGTPIVYSSLDADVCTVAGTTVTMVGVGTCPIAADQAGDANYFAAAPAVVLVALVQPTEADLSVEKTAEQPTARIGDTVGYSIVATNAGPADAIDVQVIDNPPERLDLASVAWECVQATGTACPVPAAGTGALDVTLASLPEGASVRFELFGEVVPAADPQDDFTAFDNTAVVALPAGSTLTDPAANNQDTASVQVLPEAVFTDGFEGAQ